MNSPISRLHISSVRGTFSHKASEYLFLWALRGEISLSVEDNYYTLRADDVIMLRPGTNYTLSADGGNSVLSVFMRRGFFAKGQYESLGRFICNSLTDSDRDYSPLRKILSQIALCYLEDTDIHGILLHSQAYALLYYLNRYHYVAKDLKSTYQLSEKNARRFHDILNFIERNYMYPISLQTLSDQLFLTPQYLSRLIKRCLGQNFVSYLNHVRLVHAVDDLLNTGQAIISVATGNGFSSLNTFNKLFKATYHTTPNQYRMQHSNTQNSAPCLAPKSESRSHLEFVRDTLRDYANEEAPAPSVLLYPQQSIHTVESPLRGDMYSPIWKSIINIGFSDNVHNSDLKAHMVMAQREIGFCFGRLQAILNNTLLPLMPGSGAYNFAYFDRFIQFMLSIGMKPFLDLTFKTSHLLLGSYSHACIPRTKSEGIPANAKEQFMKKVSAIIRHCINVFGQAEVESWGIEIGYLHDEKLQMLESAVEFVARFKSAYSYIKSLLPNIIVGGISHNTTLSPELLEGILTEMDRTSFSPDFISLVLFPFCSIVPPQGPDDFSISSNPDHPAYQVKRFKESLARHPALTKRVYITVFGLDLSARNHTNDSCYQGAFLIKNSVDLLDKVDALGYWQLSDIGNVYFDSNQLLFGGNGIVSQHGLKKTGYFALKLMNLACGHLVSKGGNHLITTDCRNTIVIVLFNYIHFGEQYCVQLGAQVPLNETYSIFDVSKTADITVKLMALPTGNYRITTSVLNRDHGSTLDDLLRYGPIDKLSPEDIQYFQDTVHPLRQVRYYKCEDGKLDVHAQLLPHEVRFIEIVKEL